MLIAVISTQPALLLVDLAQHVVSTIDIKL